MASRLSASYQPPSSCGAGPRIIDASFITMVALHQRPGYFDGVLTIATPSTEEQVVDVGVEVALAEEETRQFRRIILFATGTSRGGKGMVWRVGGWNS